MARTETRRCIDDDVGGEKTWRDSRNELMVCLVIFASDYGN